MPRMTQDRRGDISEAALQNVIDLMETSSWRDVFATSNDPDVVRAFRFVANRNRTAWQYFLPSGSGRSALCVGEALGATADALSRNYASVVALEPSPSRVRFMRLRFSQDRIYNVRIVRGAFADLPFGPRSFDLVAFNGAIVPLSGLRRAFELLRPNGHLFVCVDRRRSRGYRRLLRRAGFTTVQLFMAIDSCDEPEFIVPIDGAPSRFFFRQFDVAVRPLHRLVLRWTADRLGILGRLRRSFMLTATRP